MKRANPLLKRPFREFKKDIVKYLILTFFLSVVLALASGYVIGTNAVNDSYLANQEISNVEDGNFETLRKADDSLFEFAKEKNVSMESQFSIDFAFKDSQNEIRVFKNRKNIDKVILQEGKLPEEDNQIGIIDLYANANNIKIGDSISFDNKTFVVSSLLNFPDYVMVYKSKSDISYKYKTFCVSIVTDNAYASLTPTKEVYRYVYKFNEKISKDKEIEVNNNFKSELDTFLVSHLNFAASFTPRFCNRAIASANNFSKQYDSFILIFIYFVVVVVAFAFAISAVSRINEEAKTIGTLRASGYSKKRLLGNYSLTVAFVILFSLVVGDLLGYFLMSHFFANLFLALLSVNIVTYGFTLFSFLVTSLVPALLMFVVNAIVLAVYLRKDVKLFLTSNLRKTFFKKPIKISEKSSYMSKYRKRLLLHNMPSFATLVIGIILGSFLFSFGLSLRVSNENQFNIVRNEQLSSYQYILDLPALTKNKDAEEFLVYSFTYEKGGKYIKSNIPAYGIKNGSRYINYNFSNLKDDEIVLSSAFADKYNAKVGDMLKFSDNRYRNYFEFKVKDIYKYDASASLFLTASRLTQIFFNEIGIHSFDQIKEILKEIGIELKNDFYIFNAYFSNSPITDINESYIATVIDETTLYKDVATASTSSNSVSRLLMAVGIVFDILLLFFLIKVIIDKNKKDISLCKVFGFTNKEIIFLFVSIIAIATLVGLIISMPICYFFIAFLFKTEIYPTIIVYVKFIFPFWIFFAMLGTGIISLLVSLLIEMQHIKKIPMNDAIKQ